MEITVTKPHDATPMHMARAPLRVNKEQPLGPMSYTSWKANKDIQRSTGYRGYEPTYKPPGVAPPPTHTTLRDPAIYRTGMGDSFAQPQRPGSDHSHIKSRGF